jgi:hypothetical protein
MAEIMRARSPRLLGPEFDDFLCATIGVNRSGGYLSVVFSLAQIDLDTWVEAEKLAKLLIEIVARKLRSLIAELQETPPARRDSRKMATRLVALLPARTRTPPVSSPC